MFIKFSDKTKKIIVKDSLDNDENQDENEDSLNDSNDRRVKILNKYKKNKVKNTEKNWINNLKNYVIQFFLHKNYKN